MVDKELKVRFTVQGNDVKEHLNRAMTEAGSKLGKNAVDAMSRITGAFKGGGGIPALGNVASSLGGMMSGPVGTVAAGIGAIVSVLKVISDRIQKMYDKLSEASATFKGARDTLDKQMNMALRPMADIMTSLMRPYLMLIMARIRSAMQNAQPYMEGAMAGNPEDIATVQKLMEEAMTDVAYITQKMNDVVQPIAGQLQGFLDGLGASFNNFVTGIANWVTGFLDGVSKNMGPIPKTLAMWIIEQTNMHPEFLNTLPKNVSDAFYEALAGADKIKELETNSKIKFHDPLVEALSRIANTTASWAAWYEAKMAAAKGGSTDLGMCYAPQSWNQFGGGYVAEAPKLAINSGKVETW